jgi:cardiolipin synthase A/B
MRISIGGPSAANATTDPNVRLEEELAAARRGAQVRLLLDGAFAEPSDPRDNTATCAYVQAIAAAEHLDVQCRIANPTGAGIHNKMILVRAGGQGAVLTSSINGSENSAKANRELGVIVRTDAGYDYLAQLFWKDWGLASTPEQRVYLPLVASEP